MSLDNFAKSCNVDQFEKTVYPYEKWFCPKDIAQCKVFPPYSDFISSLTRIHNSKYIDEFKDIVDNNFKNEIWASIL